MRLNVALVPHKLKGSGRTRKGIDRGCKRREDARSRQIRMEFAGATYHVLARWNHGQAINEDEQDRKGRL